MNADKALELARLAYPNDENLRVAYMLGLNAGAEWGMNQCPLPEDTTIFLKGVAEGRRLEKDDNISLIESRIAEILGDAQPAPILRTELRELIEKIRK